MENKKGLQNLNLDLPSQVEYNRQKNVSQDQTLATLSSQVQQILSQRPSGFLPRVYYGLTRGAQTYRFIQDWVVNISGLSGNVGDAFEFISQSETGNYIPAIGILLPNEQVQISVQGDYTVSTTQFDIINMRDGSVLTDDLGSVLSTQPASYLGDFNADTNADKQITVLNDLETNTNNVIFASVDFNNDGIYNWIRIGGYTNGADGRSIYTITAATISAVLSGAKIGDSLVAGEAFTSDGYTFAIGDTYTISLLSPLTLTANGNLRGPKGDQGDQGTPGTNGTNGYTPYIQDGNWYINGVDTGIVAQGTNGTNGQNGQSFQMNSGLYSTPDNWGEAGNVDGDGNALLQLPTLPQATGMTGYAYVVYDPLTTPLDPYYDLYFCNDNDNDWTIIHPYSGLKGADGTNGDTPYIQDGYWYIGGVNTGTEAQGPQGNPGTNGTNGTNGYTPYIQSSNWYINGVDTGVQAEGVNGTNGVTPNISVAATQLPAGSLPTAQRSGTDAAPTITFGIPKGDTGDGFPSGGTTGQYFRKASNTDYDTEWHTLSSGDVTTALGYTPYNSTNPNGYITSAAITGKADVDASNLSSANITSWANTCGFERVEVVYDKFSNDASINWGYTNGISQNTTITDKDFTKYKYLRITFADSNYVWQVPIEIYIGYTQTRAEGYQSSVMGWGNATYSCIINKDKTSIQNSSSYSGSIYRIVGVY